MRRALQWIIGALAAAFLGSAIVGASSHFSRYIDSVFLTNMPA